MAPTPSWERRVGTLCDITEGQFPQSVAREKQTFRSRVKVMENKKNMSGFRPELIYLFNKSPPSVRHFYSCDSPAALETPASRFNSQLGSESAAAPTQFHFLMALKLYIECFLGMGGGGINP